MYYMPAVTSVPCEEGVREAERHYMMEQRRPAARAADTLPTQPCIGCKAAADSWQRFPEIQRSEIFCTGPLGVNSLAER